MIGVLELEAREEALSSGKYGKAGESLLAGCRHSVQSRKRISIRMTRPAFRRVIWLLMGRIVLSMRERVPDRRRLGVAFSCAPFFGL